MQRTWVFARYRPISLKAKAAHLSKQADGFARAKLADHHGGAMGEPKTKRKRGVSADGII